MQLVLEIWLGGAWRRAATLEPLAGPARGYLGKVSLEYEPEYAMAEMGKGGSRALSCRYLPSLEMWNEAPWPAFLLDILPAGAARRSILQRLGRSDGRGLDWDLLQIAQHAPGNVRVQPKELRPAAPHKGFERREVLERGPDFVEYAFERGAPVAGSTGAQGDAPKFLLVEDREGRWHAEGAIPDELVAAHWLVKFPRGSHSTDLRILEEEARYMALAKDAGLRANEGLVYEDGCLFIPRFDRVGSDRLGLESVASLLGVSDYGIRKSLQESAAAVARYCSHPGVELVELLLRDVFNLAVGNTDNHIRNTAVLKSAEGSVKLSPLYDVAPMILDRSMIPRAARWGENERAGEVHWAGVIDDLVSMGADRPSLVTALLGMAGFVASLAERMLLAGCDAALVERLRPRQEALALQLRKGVDA